MLAPNDSTVSDVLLSVLEAVGLDTCFGVPGGQTLPFYEVARARKFRHVMMHDERNCACAADAYARVSGKVGLCDATVGPGVTNLVSGLAEAYASSIPVIALIADIDTRLEHLRHRSVVAQAFEQRPLMEAVSKWVGRVQTPEMLLDIMAHALRVATTGRPGPVVVEIPEEVWGARLSSCDLSRFSGDDARWPRHRVVAAPGQIAKATALFDRADRPIVLAGGGAMASNAGDEIARLADDLSIPVVTSLNGKGIIDERHPLALGVVGQFGNVEANLALQQADLVLAVGTKFTTFNSFSWRLPHKNQKVIHVDVDGEELNRCITTDVEVLGDAKLVIEQILDGLLASRRSFQWQPSSKTSEQPGTPPGDPGIAPEAVVSAIRESASEKTILVSDASLSSGWSASRYKVSGSGRKFLAPRGLAGIGWSCGAAIGAALAAPADSRVVVLAGDGSAGYWLGEMETAVRWNLPITFVILNNSGFGWVIQCEKKLGFRELSTFGSVDYAAVGAALGVKNKQAKNIGEVRDGLLQAFSSQGPFVLDALTSQAADATVAYDLIDPDGPSMKTAYDV